MPRFTKFILLNVLALISYSNQGTAQTAQVPEFGDIRGVYLSGEGCPETSAEVTVSPDLKDLSVLFDNYYLETGAGTADPGKVVLEKSCRIDVDLNIPAGWRYAFASVDYRGYVMLDKHAQGFQKIGYVTDSNPMRRVDDVRFKGPYNSNYLFRASVDQNKIAWSDCGVGPTRFAIISSLGIKYHQRPNGELPLAQIALDSADLSVKQNIQLLWQKCEPNRNRPPRSIEIPRDARRSAPILRGPGRRHPGQPREPRKPHENRDSSNPSNGHRGHR
jgi:hypothetical protein